MYTLDSYTAQGRLKNMQTMLENSQHMGREKAVFIYSGSITVPLYHVPLWHDGDTDTCLDQDTNHYNVKCVKCKKKQINWNNVVVQSHGIIQTMYGYQTVKRSQRFRLHILYDYTDYAVYSRHGMGMRSTAETVNLLCAQVLCVLKVHWRWNWVEMKPSEWVWWGGVGWSGAGVV